MCANNFLGKLIRKLEKLDLAVGKAKERCDYQNGLSLTPRRALDCKLHLRVAVTCGKGARLSSSCTDKSFIRATPEGYKFSAFPQLWTKRALLVQGQYQPLEMKVHLSHGKQI